MRFTHRFCISTHMRGVVRVNPSKSPVQCSTVSIMLSRSVVVHRLYRADQPECQLSTGLGA